MYAVVSIKSSSSTPDAKKNTPKYMDILDIFFRQIFLMFFTAKDFELTLNREQDIFPKS